LDRGQQRLDRCLGRRAGVRRGLALHRHEPPARQRLVPRPRRQHLELSPPRGISPELNDLIARALEALEAQEATRAALASAPAAVRAALPRLLAASDFLAQSLSRDPQLLPQLIASGDLARPLPREEFARRAAALPAQDAAGEALVQAQLRNWRRREYVRIAWRDLAGLADLAET